MWDASSDETCKLQSQIEKNKTFKRIPQIRYHQWENVPLFEVFTQKNKLLQSSRIGIYDPFSSLEKRKSVQTNMPDFVPIWPPCLMNIGQSQSHLEQMKIWKKCRTSPEITTPLTHFGSSILRPEMAKKEPKNLDLLIITVTIAWKSVQEWKISSGCRLLDVECSYTKPTWMSRWKLGSIVRINGLFHLLINGVYWGYNPLTNHLRSSWDIQVIHPTSNCRRKTTEPRIYN